MCISASGKGGRATKSPFLQSENDGMYQKDTTIYPSVLEVGRSDSSMYICHSAQTHTHTHTRSSAKCKQEYIFLYCNKHRDFFPLVMFLVTRIARCFDPRQEKRMSNLKRGSKYVSKNKETSLHEEKKRVVFNIFFKYTPGINPSNLLWTNWSKTSYFL